MKRAGLLMIMLIAVVLAVGLAAAQGGSTKPSLTVTPTSPTVGSTFTVTSCGWRSNETVALDAGWIGHTYLFSENLSPDATGCVFASFEAFQSGDWVAQAWAQNAAGRYPPHPAVETFFTVNQA